MSILRLSQIYMILCTYIRVTVWDLYKNLVIIKTHLSIATFSFFASNQSNNFSIITFTVSAWQEL